MQIVDFRADLAGAFKALNEAWITHYFRLERKDIEVLSDPQGRIIDGGGKIVFVVEDGAAIGCCALMALPDGGFEVAKMAVAEPHKGRGLGRALMAACVERARAAGAPRLYLETNSALAPALSLYRSFGFQKIPPAQPSPYARADVVMELKL
ncbi:MAG TPA: GNAT family N-acetyltransferase [Caulobacteraceae bacterium]|jgi:ribosomal protein S18 acetylase RimI-like enzyme|nr:GNAT family N-acetyltransferase [Caulobacteraceae bacterium]